MALKDQVLRLRQNWLLLVILGVVLLLMLGSDFVSEANYSPAMDFGGSAKGRLVVASEDFAPDEERKVARTASLSSEVERGGFDAAHERLVAIVSGAEGFVLSQNVRDVGEGRHGAKSGSYELKVPVDAYGGVLDAVSGIGRVVSYSEQADDVTGRYVDSQIELAAEKARLLGTRNCMGRAGRWRRSSCWRIGFLIRSVGLSIWRML
ncbi:MAG: DUF4349 domain-containing protein [Nitrosarchaeum sp.]|nr:DUF4349 domain-containing protein [Nitrosarchaeum sp.]